VLIKNRPHIGLHRDAKTSEKGRRVVDFDPILNACVEAPSSSCINPCIDMSALYGDALVGRFAVLLGDRRASAYQFVIFFNDNNAHAKVFAQSHGCVRTSSAPADYGHISVNNGIVLPRGGY
jgi:hypothetical protein